MQKDTIAKEFNKKLELTPKQANDSSTHCHICSKVMKLKDQVRDHCHITGEYRGLAHSRCKMNYYALKGSKLRIPVVFHNLRKTIDLDYYDTTESKGLCWKWIL